MFRISVFYPKIVHTKREFVLEHFVAPNARVGAYWLIPMRFQYFYQTFKINASCFFKTVHTLADIDIGKNVFFYQIHDFILVNDVSGKSSQQDIIVLAMQNWVT